MREREREACVVVDSLVRAGRRAICLPLPSCLLCMLLPAAPMLLLSVQRPMLLSRPSRDPSSTYPWQCQRKLLNVLSTTGVHACRPAEDGDPSFRSSKHRRRRNLPPEVSLWPGDDGVVVSYRIDPHDLRLRTHGCMLERTPPRPADHSQIHASTTSHSPSTRCPQNRSLPHGIEGASSPRPTHAATVHII